MQQVKHTDMVTLMITGKPVIVDIYAPNCAPCQVAHNALIEAEAKFPEVRFVKIELKDVDPGFLRLRNIRSAPTVLAFAYGVEHGRVTGGEPSRINRLIEALVAELEDVADEEPIGCESCQ